MTLQPLPDMSNTGDLLFTEDGFLYTDADFEEWQKELAS